MRVTGERATEFEEIVGYHLEQAYGLRRELGPPDAAVRDLAARAAQSLGSAGRRAVARRDMPAAVNLLERAVSTLDERDPARLAMIPDLAETLIDVGELAQGGRLSHSGDRRQRRVRRRAHACRSLDRLHVRPVHARPGGMVAAASEVADQAISTLERHEDHSSLSKAWRLIASIHGLRCQYADAEDALRHAVAEARQAGDRRQELVSLPTYALSAGYGPTPVPEAIRICEQLLEQTADSRSAVALVHCVLAHLRGLAGDIETAREHYRTSRSIYDELGMRLYGALVSLDSAPVEMLAGNAEAAERDLRVDYETLIELGDKSYLPTTAALLAQALHELGRDEEAEQLTQVSEEHSFPDDVNSEVEWRCARARIKAGRGELEEAERLARDAVVKAMGTDFLEVQGNARLDLAEVLAHAGRTDEAAVEASDALAAYARKQCTASTARAVSRLTALGVRVGETRA